MNLVEILKNLEPTFIEAGKLALEMQKGVGIHQKYTTGNPLDDIVTDADFAVQEFLLKEIGKTELVNCRLFAEENTNLVNKFNQNGKYILAIDPIDGTAIYAKGGKCFSVIISLHDGEKILYMFGYYPALDWKYRVSNNHFSATEHSPNLEFPEELRKMIVYWNGNPEKNLPKNVLEELKSKGISFKNILDISYDLDTTTALALNKVAGAYEENPDVYDGITELSIALARGLKIYSGGPNGKFDLSNIQKRESGFYYPGWYLTLKN